MKWIVKGEKSGKILLVSQKGVSGMLPKGSFLTVEEGKTRFILRVDDSGQHELYSPDPLVIDMDLSPLEQDRESKNVISAYRVHDISIRSDGLIDYIKPLSKARRSTQEEIDIALDALKQGPKVFIATIQYDKNQLIADDNGKFITATLPKDMFFHQMLISGTTGSGKTVAMKYLAQYFVEDLGGAVLAVNVKDTDLLKMNEASTDKIESVNREWAVLGNKAHGVENFIVYYPANTKLSPTKRIDMELAKKVTLDVKSINPEALIGLLQNISDIGAMNLPDIFRFWQDRQKSIKENNEFMFGKFVDYFLRGHEDNYVFSTLNVRGETSEVTLHKGTYDNIARNLNIARVFFDDPNGEIIDEKDILQHGKMSVIDVAEKNGVQFGSILLRQLLSNIVAAKSEQRSDVPILIIIDEVHMFYNTSASNEALGDLDTICRTGRSQEIGVIFASQNPNDMPKGLSSVINTKIFFKSDPKTIRSLGLNVTSNEAESLKKGFAICSIHNLSQLKVIKFPLSFSGVFK